MMRVRRLLTRGPNDEAIWRTIHVRPIDERWVAMILTDGEHPPGPDETPRHCPVRRHPRRGRSDGPEASRARHRAHLTQRITLTAGPPRLLS
jgi:hypothetical protein